ncbi:MAG TPA: hypothetical protein G4O11_01420 [Anaerolineae bacterium]|nr:hypothetical protein [Anaerolineae bacterium]
MPNRGFLRKFNKEQLIDLLEDAAKNWLAHDGVWFQAVEGNYGIEEAVRLDAEAWERFTVIEAHRIMKRHGIKEGGGLPALEQALNLRMYALINKQSTNWVNERTLRFEMNDCRVQSTRQRKGLPDFPCKSVGLVEYAGFARTIDPRIQMRCIACPPDPHPEAFFCAWEFSIAGDTK